MSISRYLTNTNGSKKLQTIHWLVCFGLCAVSSQLEAQVGMDKATIEKLYLQEGFQSLSKGDVFPGSSTNSSRKIRFSSYYYDIPQKMESMMLLHPKKDPNSNERTIYVFENDQAKMGCKIYTKPTPMTDAAIWRSIYELSGLKQKNKRKMAWDRDPDQQSSYPKLGNIVGVSILQRIRTSRAIPVGMRYTLWHRLDLKNNRILGSHLSREPINAFTYRYVPSLKLFGRVYETVPLRHSGMKQYAIVDTIRVPNNFNTGTINTVKSIVVADADTYWKWRFSRLLKQFEQNDDKRYFFPQSNYESKLYSTIRYKFRKNEQSRKFLTNLLLETQLFHGVGAATGNPNVAFSTIEPALEKLAEVPYLSRAASRAIGELIKKQKPVVKRRYLEILSRLPEKEAVPPMIQMLKDKNGDVADYASECLKEWVKNNTQLKDVDFGTDSRKWNKWWKEHKLHFLKKQRRKR